MKQKETNNQVAKNLKKEILASTKKGFSSLKETEVTKADNFAINYKKFLDNSKTERDAVKYSKMLVEKEGFTEFDNTKKYNPGDKVYFINRGKAIGFAVIGKNGVKNGANLVIAHIDSPRIDLKPYPIYEESNLALFKTQYYGGIKKYQWTAIPLALVGTVIKLDGTSVDINIGNNENETCFTITDLLPHLSSEQYAKTIGKAIEGEDLNVLVGSRPFNNEEETNLVKLNIVNILNKKYGIVEDDFLSAELSLVPAFNTRDVGFDESLIGGYGQDDRVCAYPALLAAINAETPDSTAITYLVDKEETGSDGNTGMQSDYLKYIIYDFAKQDGIEGYHAISKSKCLSADVNAAFDPTYASAYDPRNASYINKGVVISKYTGHSGKASTSDASAEYMGEIRSMLENNNVQWQVGELGRVDLGGGGTIAKFVANWNVDVIDIGVPVLSMHSPFEIASKTDIYMAYKAFLAFYK